MVKALSWRLIWILGLGLKRKKAPCLEQSSVILIFPLDCAEENQLTSTLWPKCGLSNIREKQLQDGKAFGWLGSRDLPCPGQSLSPLCAAQPPWTLCKGEKAAQPACVSSAPLGMLPEKQMKREFIFCLIVSFSELIPFKSLKLKYLFFGKSLGRFGKTQMFLFFRLVGCCSSVLLS